MAKQDKILSTLKKKDGNGFLSPVEYDDFIDWLGNYDYYGEAISYDWRQRWWFECDMDKDDQLSYDEVAYYMHKIGY